MKISKKLFVGMFVIVLTLILVSFVAAQYTRASPSYVQPGLGLSVGTGGKFIPDRSLCEAGQDFVIQIAPFGCEPAVVPSDLLEEQNVPVFCQLAATQLNVLADVNTIDRISFTGNHPEEVSGVGFHPARAALGRLRRGDVARSDNLLLNNIGYAVIVLKKQPNEDAMPDFVEGNLTANIRYDIENAFGIGRATFYLQDSSLSGSRDLDLRNRFWNGRFYLDASSIGEKDAVIEIYDDSGRVGSVRLDEGKTSNDIFLPGFDCYAGVKLRLDDLTVPVPRAKLDVNGDLIEVAEGEKFLENRCEIKRGGINSEGIVQSVEITCKKDDGKSEKFELEFSPKVKLNGGIEGDNIYERGDLVKIDDGKRIYLVGVKKDKEGVLKVFLGVSSSTKTKLDSSELKKVRGIKEIEKDGEKDGINFIGLALEDAVSIEGPPETGSTSESIEFSENFGNAVNDFDIVINDFSNEKYPGENEDEPLLSEEALKQKILLAQSVGNQLSRFDYCREFEDRYPNSNILRNLKQDVCNEDNLFFSNSEIASTEVVVNNVFRDISLREIIQPKEEEYSLELIIRREGDIIATPMLRQGIDVRLSQYGGDEGDFVKLVSLTETSARIEVSLEDKKVRGRKTIKINEILGFGSETYSFAINKINLKKVAKVTVIPSIQDAGTTATFNYKIGIDKRLFTLSPEKAKKKIEALDKKIEKWEEISANLGGFVKGMKAACLATGAALTVKNLFTSTGGQALARQDVMNGPGGWYEKCAEAVEKGTLDGKSVNYASPEACLFDSTNSDAIDKQVESYAQDLIDVNDEISGFEDNLKGYNSRVAGNLIGVDVCSSVIGKDNSIDFGSFEAGVGLIDENKRFLSEEDTRDLDLWRRRLERDAKDKRALEEYCTRALEIDQRYSSIKRIEETEERLKNSGIIGARARHFRGKDAKEEIYDGAVVSDGGFGSIPTETRVQVIVFGSEEYIVSLKPLPGTSGEYRINKVYDDKGIELTDKDESTSNGNKIATATLIKNSYSVFKSFDESTYRNPYRNPEVRYYETRNAQGQPAIVPIDTKNGWYVATSNVFQASDGLRAFSSSGRVESFWLCNVGENGLEQNRRPDDICQGINLAIGETYSQFHGLSRSEVKSLVDKGVRAIAEAERAHRSGIKKVRILGRELNVGSPAVDIPDAQCTDFMSPKDCKLLFNVCDPVICPSSRCDFGGSYPVKDVVQSGIVGSIALCLPNFQEGIVVPVCLTGIQSGIDSWNAVQKEYRSCLQDSVDTGQLTGICDEVYSIRACEFFWRQAFPLAKLAVPKLISFATGENVRGGGEYALVQSAWDNTEASVNYFTNYYAANSFKAFKARSADEFGGEICRNFVSGIVPSGNFFDALVEPDSPPQFHGRFDENTFTTATNPPTSQYKVFYFIYAGKDSRAFYQVYLKGDPSSSYYQDVGFRRVVASGFIPRGEQISETRDFIAPSGYREMCINVNGQEECGFQEVSTSFAVNYIKDQYLAEQAIDKVTTEEQCVAGSSSAFTLLNPNIQSGIEQTITPELYKRGIVRICATKDPGVGTDNKAGVINESRWADVGYCGDRNLRCWLDTDSVKEVIKDLDTEGKALSEVNARFQDRLRQSGEYLDGEDVTAALDKLEDIDKKLRDRTNRMSTQERKELSADINTVNSIINKLFFSHHRAFAHFVRGEVYGWLAREGRPDVDKKPTAQGESRDEESGAETPLADNCSEFNGFPDICESYQNCLWNSESNICEERPIITNEDDESQFNEDIASAEDSGADIISGTDFIYDDEEQVIAEDIYETISLPKLTQSGTVSLNVEYDEEKCDSLRYELKREVVFGAFDWTIREGSFKGDIEFGGAFFKEGVKYHAEVICIKDGKKIDEPRFSNEIVYGDQ